MKAIAYGAYLENSDRFLKGLSFLFGVVLMIVSAHSVFYVSWPNSLKVRHAP